MKDMFLHGNSHHDIGLWLSHESLDCNGAADLCDAISSLFSTIRHVYRQYSSWMLKVNDPAMYKGLVFNYNMPTMTQ